MNDNPFEIKEEACASSPDHRRYLLIQAVDTETGEIVWAVGDDQICAVTRADFIRTPEIRYPDGSPMGKVANTVLRLKRQETHRIFDRFWREQGWTRSAAYRWLAQNLHLKEHETHIGMMEMDECEQVIRLCRKYGKHKKEAA